MSLPVINEIIVVEGRDDESAVKRAVDAGIICTHGYGISEATLELIDQAYKRCGIIIFTDPDHAGNNIRKKLTALFPEARQAYLTRAEALKDGDIGIENAAPGDILRALMASLGRETEGEGSIAGGPPMAISRELYASLGFSGRPESSALRAETGKILGIGSANGNTFFKRLNSFGVSEEELIKAWKTASQNLR